MPPMHIWILIPVLTILRESGKVLAFLTIWITGWYNNGPSFPLLIFLALLCPIIRAQIHNEK